MNKLIKGSCAALILLATACNFRNNTDIDLIPPAESFQLNIAGKQTNLYTLKNTKGIRAAITNYGGRLVSLIVPDEEGTPTSVVAGFKDLSGYINSTEPYFGATIGRYGNRIAKGKFELEGQEYQLSINNGPNTLHGGRHGFQYKVWDAERHGDSSLVLRYNSRDREEGFPGNLKAQVIYTLTEKNELVISYSASTDKPTVVNLTNHAFFNLNGEGSGNINGHLLQINADHFTPVDSTLIPTGKIEPVTEGNFDFRISRPIGKFLYEKDQQLLLGKGYDHNFVLQGKNWKQAATVVGNHSGIKMQVWTTEPGLQFYGGNFMQSKNDMRRGKDDFRTAFCLETQHFPDSPNQKNFPSTELKPGETYKSKSVYAFSIN